MRRDTERSSPRSSSENSVDDETTRSGRRTTARRSFVAALGVGGVASMAGLTGADDEHGADHGGPDGRDDRSGRPPTDSSAGTLTEVASFPDRLVTGVAVSGDDRVFTSFPRFPWAVPVDISVGEVTADGSVAPYPNAAWNRGQWNTEEKEWVGSDPTESFVGVQSVHVEPEAPNTLWALDTGNPMFEAIVDGGPKLVRIDLERNAIEDVHYFSPEVTPETNAGVAYLNDVRVDVERNVAYLTESELGALVVVDLETGEDRRIMDDWASFPSTHHRPNGHYNVGPHEDQTRPMPGPTDFHADGIAITHDNEYLYYHALSGRDLYRLETAALRDFSLSEDEIAARVERVGETDITDGMLTDEAGNVYHTDLEDDAITRWNASTGEMETVARDSDLLKWPDSLAWGSDGDLYVTTSKLHLEMTETRTEPFRVLRIPDVGP